jgi:hypothetical protein
VVLLLRIVSWVRVRVRVVTHGTKCIVDLEIKVSPWAETWVRRTAADNTQRNAHDGVTGGPDGQMMSKATSVWARTERVCSCVAESAPAPRPDRDDSLEGGWGGGRYKGFGRWVAECAAHAPTSTTAAATRGHCHKGDQHQTIHVHDVHYERQATLSSENKINHLPTKVSSPSESAILRKPILRDDQGNDGATTYVGDRPRRASEFRDGSIDAERAGKCGSPLPLPAPLSLLMKTSPMVSFNSR